MKMPTAQATAETQSVAYEHRNIQMVNLSMFIATLVWTKSLRQSTPHQIGEPLEPPLANAFARLHFLSLGHKRFTHSPTSTIFMIFQAPLPTDHDAGPYSCLHGCQVSEER